MTPREQLNGIPRWRVGLYAFVAGGGLVVALSLFGLGQGLLRDPYERDVQFLSRASEKSITQTTKKSTTARATYRRESLTFLALPEGGILLDGARNPVLVPVVESGERELGTSEEQIRIDVEKHTETQQRTRETPVLPSWSVGVLVGGQFVGKPALQLPNAPGLVVGIEAGYRVPLDKVGIPPRYSLWVTGWGTTSGAAGGGLRGEF